MSVIPTDLTIDWLRENYQNGTVTPKEIIEEIIQRAENDNTMNIWITPPDMKWIKPYIDRLEGLDFPNKPLWGIPFAIKDNIDLGGVPTTVGCEEYTYTPIEHASVVEKLIDAGAIPVGKTNLDQFATGLVGTRSPYGETHNAIREELISGGSSAGSAVALARGQAAFALGTDTAGSGRVPAALNNLVGYKPSLGAWSTKGVVPACESLDCVTVFAHHLADAREVDKSARGEDLRDPWSKKWPVSVPALPEKVYLPKDTPEFFGPYAKGYKKAWKSALRKIENLDLVVEYIDTELFSAAAEVLYGGPWIAERWAALGGFIEANPDTAFPVTEKVLRSGEGTSYSAASLFEATHKLQNLKLEARKLLEKAVLIMPTCGGTWTREQVRENPVSTNSDMGKYTNHCNLLDLCAVAIPAGEAAIDTPFGITLFSLANQEGLIYGAADLLTTKRSAGQLDIEAQPLSVDETDMTLVAVCGLHMRGFPLEKQMHDCKAVFVKEAVTVPRYQMIKLPGNPAKPGLIKQQEGGSAIHLEIWEMPLSAFGEFTASIPAPLGMGKVELKDGTELPGFICEGYAEVQGEDITTSGGWKQLALK